MPLHGKIVVIKRSGGDGTEFPLTAACLFGRKPDCDIRIQLPQVSKEHCRIDLNENKEVILTNLSSVNPTLVNGEVLLQSERLKHGDVITIIDRSFRFEYPPAPTPKKRTSTGGKVLQDQQVVHVITVESDEKRISEISTDPHLKDGTNNDNIQRSLEKTMELESEENVSLLQNKTTSPFGDLYQMIKKSLDVKTPRKSSASVLQTPTSRFCTPKPGSVRKNVDKSAISTEDKSTSKKDEVEVFSGTDESKEHVDSLSNGTPKSVRKQRKSLQVPTTETDASTAEDGQQSITSDATSPQKRIRTTPQRFTACEVIEQISAQTPKSPTRRRSKEATPAKSAVTVEQQEEAKTATKTERQKKSPRNSGNVEKAKEISKKRKSGELAADLPTSQMKKKRVSFGGYLSPELFDKRLPPDSPLRKGATPRRSLCVTKSKQSLLRRASVIGFLKEFERDGLKVQSLAKIKTPSPKKSVAKNASPKTPTSGKKSPKSKTPSPAKKSPKSNSPSPKAASPKSKTLSPKAASPAKKSPKSKTPSPRAQSSEKKVNDQPKTPISKRRSSMVVGTPVPQENAPNASVTPAKTPLSSRAQTPTVQGRFSVSRISTPSPVAEDAVSDQVTSIAVTPKIPLRRKSMKSTSRRTPGVTKSAVKVMRRSGISRASIKVTNSWADIVKFGQTKTQVAAPAKKIVTQKVMKRNVSKPQTPARKLKGHVSTGHADSPVTIVVGRAHKQKVVHPIGAAPRVVTNIAMLKKDMKMDEDLTGISEMFKTPVNERKRKSVISDNVTTTPVGSLGISVVEPSVLTTPEEPGEMMVSPLSVASSVKGRRYNSEAVQRLLNVDQESSFVSEDSALEIHSGVKRIMKTPRQKAEPVEDIRGKLLVTPKQKPQPQECLTGVKRVMKTPRGQEADVCLDGVKELLQTPVHIQESKVPSEMGDMQTPFMKISPVLCLTGVDKIMKTRKEKSSPVEDMVGEKRLRKTPREKSKPVEDNFGIKRLMKSPRLRGNAPVEDFEGLQELMEEPLIEPTGCTGTNEVETDPDCGINIAKETQANDVNHVEEMPSEHNLSEEQQEVETATVEVTEINTAAIDHDHEKKSVRGRRAKVAESKPVEDKQAETENSVDAVMAAPVRGRRGKKIETTPAIRQTTRNRSKDVEITMEESVPQPSKVVVKPKRGRNAKKASEDEAQMQEVSTDAETMSEAESKECPPANVETNNKAAVSAVPLEKAVAKPRRGRKTKQESGQSKSTLEQQDVPLADVAEGADEVCHDQLETVSENDNKKSADDMEPVPQEPVTESLHQVEMAPCNEDVVAVQKKAVRGRMVKNVDLKAAETEQSEEPAVAAPVRGRRGRKAEVAAPPVRQKTRSRNTKSQESTSNPPEVVKEKAEETTLVTDISAEAVTENSAITSQQENDSTPFAEEAVVKPIKGRKAKTPVKPPQPEPEENNVVSDQHLEADVQPQQPINTVGKTRRGRKMQQCTAEPTDAAEDTLVTVETKQHMQPVGRAKRGRNAKQQEEKVENDSRTSSTKTHSEEPVKKLRKTRMTEPMEEIQTSEIVAQEVAEEPLTAESVKINEESTVAAKPRRGGRKPKQETGNEIPLKSTEVQELSAVGSTDKPKRGTRGKRVVEEVEVASQIPEKESNHELEAEKKKNAEDAPVIKSSRAKEVKMEVSHTIPAKRARRGAALPIEENNAESTALISESASVEPAKRGRRAAAKPTPDNATVSSAPSEELSSAVVENTKVSKRSVKWKADLEVFEIPKATPVKAARGRKSKAEAESKNVSEDARKTEEKDLSDKTVEAQPVKRARRGAKVADEAESLNKVEPKKAAEAETQQKTRRGRSARK